MRGAVPVAGAPHNTLTLVKANGRVVFTAVWQWDGVSTDPNFAGTVLDVRVQNLDNQTWYAHLPAKTRGAKRVDLTGGLDQTVTGNGLRGMDVLAALTGLRVTTEP